MPRVCHPWSNRTRWPVQTISRTASETYYVISRVVCKTVYTYVRMLRFGPDTEKNNEFIDKTNPTPITWHCVRKKYNSWLEVARTTWSRVFFKCIIMNLAGHKIIQNKYHVWLACQGRFATSGLADLMLPDKEQWKPLCELRTWSKLRLNCAHKYNTIS